MILLKINFGETINTLISFFNFNSSIIDIRNYINLNNYEIENRIQKILVQNPRLINIKILFISHFSLKYILFNLILWLIYFFKFLIQISSLVEKLLIKIIFYKRKKKINIDIKINVNHDKIDMSYKIKLRIFKFNNFLKRLNSFLYKYFISFFTVEMPNIIFLIIIYSTTFNKDFFNSTSIFINFIFIYNLLLIIFYIFDVLKIIESYNYDKDINDIKNIITPFKIKYRDSYLIYYKIVENTRIMITLMVIIYLNQIIIIQIILLLSIQTFYLIYIFYSYENNTSIKILISKEILIFIFIIFILWILLLDKNKIFINVLAVIIILIFIISLIEFILNIMKCLLEFIKKICKNMKKKKIADCNK